jgi:RimJ/RimL family protein N-acetyltransferase
MQGFDPRLRLSTERLLLRPFAEPDADSLVDMVRDAEMQRWMAWAPGYDRERAVNWCTNAAHEDPEHSVNLAIVPHGDDRIAGGVGLARVSWEDGYVEIGYWIAAWARGSGYATEATLAMSRYAFTRGLHRVELLAATGNLPSQRVAIKSGFTREGVLREARPIPGGRSDMVIFSLLRGELPDTVKPPSSPPTNSPINSPSSPSDSPSSRPRRPSRQRSGHAEGSAGEAGHTRVFPSTLVVKEQLWH